MQVPLSTIRIHNIPSKVHCWGGKFRSHIFGDGIESSVPEKAVDCSRLKRKVGYGSLWQMIFDLNCFAMVIIYSSEPTEN